MTRALCLAVVTTLLLDCLSASHAFVHITTPSGRPVFWSPPAVTIDLQVGCAPNDNTSPWGQTCVWNDATKDATGLWNAAGARFTFTTAPADSTARPCVRDGFNSVGWLDHTCHDPFGPDVVAVTGSWYNNVTGRMIEADVLFNSTLDWGTYTGPLHPSVPNEFHRVALHELGHVLGLDHPDEYGQIVHAIMNSRSSDIDRLQPDDIAGIQAIYGVKQAPPKGALENPGPNATKSGISFVSGWVCEATQVEVEVKGVRIAASYRLDRGDTRSICGDTNNGFLALVNWNLFGAGTHRIRLLADGRELTNRSVKVVTYGAEFLRSQSGYWLLEDWPWSGTDTVIGWTESLQNFEILDIR